MCKHDLVVIIMAGNFSAGFRRSALLVQSASCADALTRMIFCELAPLVIVMLIKLFSCWANIDVIFFVICKFLSEKEPVLFLFAGIKWSDMRSDA